MAESLVEEVFFSLGILKMVYGTLGVMGLGFRVLWAFCIFVSLGFKVFSQTPEP